MDNTIIVAIIAVMPTILLLIAQSRGRKADTDNKVADTYKALLESLNIEIERLSVRISCIEEERIKREEELEDMRSLVNNLRTILEAYVDVEGDLREGVIILIKQVKDSGEEPKYTLPPKLHFKMEEEQKE